MPRNLQFQDVDVVCAWKLKSEGLTHKEIAEKMNRSRSGITNLLKKRENYAVKSRCGRPRITTPCQDRRILRNITKENISIRKLAAVPGIEVSKDTIHRRLKESQNVVYKKFARIPKLLPRHINNRLEWSKKFMTWDLEWQSVIFSDEKKFNLDGPDGWMYYWHDIRKAEQGKMSRQMGGGSCMVWAAFGYNGFTDIAFIDGKLNSEKYADILKEYLLPIAKNIGGHNYKFQQDNCSIHTSKYMDAWFRQNNMNLQEHPAVSPDLNPMENLWGILVRDVYNNGRQFETVMQLKMQIKDSWAKMNKEVGQRLIKSMKDRVFKLILNRGSYIGY